MQYASHDSALLQKGVHRMPQRKLAIPAVILSILFMGLGQLYNRQIVKGLVMAITWSAGLIILKRQLLTHLYGLWTLGETPRSIVKIGKMYQPVDGDHSIYLMVQGLIALLVAIIFIVMYGINIKDAYQVARKRERGGHPHTFGQTIDHIKEHHFAYLILFIPAIAALFLNILPLIFSIMIAFTNYAAPILPPANLIEWTGFETFKNLFMLKSWSRTFYGVLGWTIVWAILSTLTTFLGGMLLAVLIQQKEIRFKRFWRSIIIVPFAIPNLVSLLVFRNLLNTEFGPINQYLRWFGLDALPWLTDPYWAKVTVLMVNLWLAMPIFMVLVSGILTTIPRDLYEAAEVDGGTPFQLFSTITVPMVLFSTAPVLIMQFAANINNFNVIYLLTDGNPVMNEYQYAGATDLLVTWLYKLTLTNRQYNFSAVIGILIFILIAGLSIINYRRTRSFKEDDIIQ
jgi:arabinogalactan oligomer / maltooligosaccharide transport system permease protein